MLRPKLRYGLKTLLTVQLLVAAAAVWWITWPDRTAERFVRSLQDPKVSLAHGIVPTVGGLVEIGTLRIEGVPGSQRLGRVTERPGFAQPKRKASLTKRLTPSPARRSFADILAGRASYQLRLNYHLTLYLDVCRDEVVIERRVDPTRWLSFDTRWYVE